MVDRPPRLLFPGCLLVSLVAHGTFVPALDALCGHAPPRRRPVRVTFAPRPEPADKAPAHPRPKRFIDVPKSVPVGTPSAPTDKIGRHDVRAADLDTRKSRLDHEPHMDGTTQAYTVPRPAGGNRVPGSTRIRPAAPAKRRPAARRPSACPARDRGVLAKVPRPHPPQRRAPRAKPSPGRSARRIPRGRSGLVIQQLPQPPRKSPDSRADKRGAPIYNIKMHEYAPYYKHIRDRVLLNWSVRSTARYSRLYPSDRRIKIVVNFQVNVDGYIDEDKLELADDGGALLLAADVLAAVGNASPFDKFPKSVKEDRLAISFHFHF